MNIKLTRSALLSALLFLLTPVIVFGQNTDELCRAFIDQVYSEMGTDCANLGADEACYAYGSFGEVTLTFYENGEPLQIREDFFEEPSERTSLLDQDELATVESIETQSFVLDRDNDDEDENRWGVVVQEVTANLPSQLDQNTAVYVLFGGIRIENDIFPEDALILQDPVEVVVNDDVDLFGSPVGLGYTVPDTLVASVSGTLEVDAKSPDEEWLRVFFIYDRDLGQRATAWVRTEDTDISDDVLESLPEIGPDTATPMQSLFFTSERFNPTVCPDIVPNPGMLVQGPDEIETDFFVNNVPMRLTSTVLIEHISPRRMRVTTLVGFTELFPDTAESEIIPEGYTRVLCLTQPDDLGIDGQENDRELDPDCPETGASPLSGNDLNRLRAFAGLSGNLLNSGINQLPTESCPSGIGAPICVTNPASVERIRQLCEAGTLPDSVCERFGITN